MRGSTLPLFALLFIAALLQITPALAQTPDNIQISGKYGNMHIPYPGNGIVVFTGRTGGTGYVGDFVFRTFSGGDADFNNSAYYNENIFRIIGKTGFVGMSTQFPRAPLSLGATKTRNTILALWEPATDNAVYGMGIQPAQFRLHLGHSAARFSFLNGPAGSELMTIKGNGQVGIGIDSASVAAMPADYRLVVKGSILSEEVKVQLAGFWPDYVFKPAYKLKPLSEVATYIRLNGHLPNIPSAAQVAQDGGIKIGEMNAKLLEKVEELTLYLIEQQKQAGEQQKQMERLQARISQLEAAASK